MRPNSDKNVPRSERYRMKHTCKCEEYEIKMAVNVLVFVFMLVFGAGKRHREILMVGVYLRGIQAAPVLFTYHS